MDCGERVCVREEGGEQRQRVVRGGPVAPAAQNISAALADTAKAARAGPFALTRAAKAGDLFCRAVGESQSGAASSSF